MNIQEMRPDLRKFVEDQVREGKFSSASQVIEAGVERLMHEEQEIQIDDDMWAAIQESEGQIARGEDRDFKEVAAELRKEFLGE